MKISKTNYLDYTNCRKNLWLKKHKPEVFVGLELSEFEQKMIEEGAITDEVAQQLYPNGVLVNEVGAKGISLTKELIDAKTPTIFQATFEWNDFFHISDILIYNDELNGYELYEVKGSNSVKRKPPYNYINDLCFQKTIIEKNGINIIKSGVIHLNGKYRFQDKLNLKALFVHDDVTNRVIDSQGDVIQQMLDVKKYLSMPEEKGCECLYRGRRGQCQTFQYSNPQVPEYSIHDLSGIGKSKKLLNYLVDLHIYKLEDIDVKNELKGLKKIQYDSYMSGKPIIDKIAIKNMLDDLEFPLYFLDFEGYTGAIPRFNGFGPYQQVPFQYSLHILHEDGVLDHKEYLITEPTADLTLPLVKKMREDIEDDGTIISWSNYEIQRILKLIELNPSYTNFLLDLNYRMFDLMTIFSKKHYVDASFKGGWSIKKVLPILIPELSYAELEISGGTQAMTMWGKMLEGNYTIESSAQIQKDLLEYCKLDTYAMVEIYRFLTKLN